MAVGEVLLESFKTIKIILVYGWPFMVLIWLFIMKSLYKNWPVDIVIIEKRGDNLIKTNDRGGKYVDPYTGMTGYKLQKCKDTVAVVNYDWVLHNVNVPTTFFDRLINILRPTIGTIFFFRYGSKQYKPIKIEESGNLKTIYKPMEDDEGNPIMVQIYQQFDPRDKLGALNFEVVDWDNMNFMVQEQRASMERRVKKGEWMKSVGIPLMILAVAALVSIIMIKFAFDFATATRGSSLGGSVSQPPASVPDIPIIGNIVPGA